MPRQSRAKLVPPNTEREKQVEMLEEASELEHKEEPALTELDLEIECPRCYETMELQSSFDKLMYTCESCSFLLKCI
jgi:phage FluMu protein Com